MPHFFIGKNDEINNSLIKIRDRGNYRHIARALRARVGEKLLLIDENQMQYETVINEITNNYILQKETGNSRAEITYIISPKKYDKYVKDKYSEDKCIICQYNFIELEAIVGLPCKHFFHFNCLKPWVDKQHYCPLCKTNIRKEPIQGMSS